MSDQVMLLNNRPSMTLVRSTYDHTERDRKQASLDDYCWRAWGSPKRLPTRPIVGQPGREPVRTVQRSIVLRERVGHVHCTMIASRPRLARLQLAGKESSWQGRTAAVIATLQVSEMWPRSRKKLTQTIRSCRPQTKRWQVSSSQQTLLNIGEKHSKSRQMNTFPKYKYQRLNPNRGETVTWS